MRKWVRQSGCEEEGNGKDEGEGRKGKGDAGMSEGDIPLLFPNVLSFHGFHKLIHRFLMLLELSTLAPELHGLML